MSKNDLSEPDYPRLCAADTNLPIPAVSQVIKLLDEGSTVPFIARYRKEATGGLDEVQITAIRDSFTRIHELEKRRKTILESIASQGLLSDELKKSILDAASSAQLEDLYLPYRPKRRTRAMIARERGREPLALTILDQKGLSASALHALAGKHVVQEKGVESAEAALAGASDIIAELFNEDARIRGFVRERLGSRGILSSRLVEARKAEDGAAQYRDYFAHSEKYSGIAGHRFLAIMRGLEEGYLRFSIDLEELPAEQVLRSFVLKKSASSAERNFLLTAMEDGYRRLMQPSLENELRQQKKLEADSEAIGVFSENLRNLLMAPALGQKVTLGVDPGLRTGCKLAVVDSHGDLLAHDVMYPLAPRNDEQGAGKLVVSLIERFHIQAVAVGNGTGGRETMDFLRRVLPKTIILSMVSESGASVYSASEEARRELGEYDLTVRGAVSIARRLMDPLAELVKIDPKAIGVGQYQHDVDQKLLRQSLDDVVSSCVNRVGVEINTASPALLSHVAGLNPKLAAGIVRYRSEKKGIRSRKELLAVPGLGARTFEQAAGFLRIRDGEDPLDASAVHPERYGLVKRMAGDLGVKLKDLVGNSALSSRIKPESYVGEDVGLPTLRDIIQELQKPGRDPRETFEEFSFAEGVDGLDDLVPGMILPGIVSNVTKFGAFIDIGVHQDGLVHISQLADQFVKDPAQVVKVQQRVMVKVLEVDRQRGRIGLSMKGLHP